MKGMKHGTAHGNAREHAYYDGVFSRSAQYKYPWRKMSYASMWTRIAKELPEGAHVLEVGCGTGQLAACLHELCKLGSYHGFDFSPVAIETAKKVLPDASFEVADARLPASYDRPFDAIVMTEVLEHIQDDLAILRMATAASPGAKCFFSVPSKDDPGHVRYFPGAASVVGRYAPLLDKLDVTVFAGRRSVWFLGVGCLREKAEP